MQKVFISGMGIYCAAGLGVAAFKKALIDGSSLVKRSEGMSALSFEYHCAGIDEFDLRSDLNTLLQINGLSENPDFQIKRLLRCAGRSSLPVQVSLMPALEAWGQAKLHEKKVAPQKVAIIVSGQNVTQNYTYNLRKRFDMDPAYLSPEYAMQFMDTDHLGTITEILPIRGEGSSVGGASASGNIGLMYGRRLIAQGIADVCVVIGCMAELSPMEIQGFYQSGALGKDRCTPFDQAHCGFVPGEAGACVILESESSATRRKLEPLCELSAVATLLAGSRQPSPDAVAEAAVINKALLEAGLSPSDIHYINTHGTSSVIGDEAEIAAIDDVFGSKCLFPWVNATKAIVGHNLWSAAIVEAIATILQMRDDVLHPNEYLQNPISDNIQWAPKHSIQAMINVAINNSFGFGGINSCSVFSKIS